MKKNGRSTRATAAAAAAAGGGSSAVSKCESECYCGGERDVGSLELWCAGCDRWYHGKCLRDFRQFNALPFMICYTFSCRSCSPTSQETWVPKVAHFGHMLVTALANLTWRRLCDDGSNASRFFSLKEEIIPFFVNQWENLTSMPRRQTTSWHHTLKRTMLKDVSVFASESADVCGGGVDVLEEESSLCGADDELTDVRFGLVEADLSRIGPNSEIVKLLARRSGGMPSSSSGASLSAACAPAIGATASGGSGTAATAAESSDEAGPKTRGRKRALAESAGGNAQSQSSIGTKRTRMTTDYTSMKPAGSSVVVEHPFNRDGHRYFLVEPDPHAPNRKEFEEREETAGKPIPGYLYRVVVPSAVELSSHDRAPQLRQSDCRTQLVGDKGYSVARGTHGVSSGAWFWEATVFDQPEGSHARIGWVAALGSLQAPAGYDKFGYACRSRKGTVFHDSRGRRYARPGYGAGDTLGCLIVLPRLHSGRGIVPRGRRQQQPLLPESRKDLPLIKFKNHFYFEEKDDVAAELKRIAPLKGSKVIFFVNGQCKGVAFENIYDGVYYPAISLYKNCAVRANFGPRFKYPPNGIDYRPMCRRAEEAVVEQCLSDMIYVIDDRNCGVLSALP